MSKICIIKQPAGLGDIIFCQKIASKSILDFNCNKVIWYVNPVYEYIKDYIINDNVFFEIGSCPNYGYNIINNEKLLYIPLESSDLITNHEDNRAHGHIKYKFFFNTDYSDWKNYFEIKRNYDRENNLIKELGINLNNKYNLINPNFGTYPNFKRNNSISPNNDFENIYMDFLPNFNIFDWMGVIENAQEIHTMETSLYYILEKLNISDNVYIYSKYTYQYGVKDNYSYMKSHCNNKWNFV